MTTCTEQQYREILSANVQLNTAVWSMAAVIVVMFFILMGFVYIGLPLRRK